MAATSKNIPLSGNRDIDALLVTTSPSSGTIWSSENLTVSFPTSANFYDYAGLQPPNETAQGFQTFTAGLQDAARKAFAIYSQYTNLKFTEIGETSNTHADIRLALADIDAIGRGYFPGDADAKSGDLWLDSGSGNLGTFGLWGSPSQISQGGEGFKDLMHEIGHTLGLSHPSLPLNDPHLGWDYTIMSPDLAFPGATIETSANAQSPETPMLADVAALQYMYGANFNTNAGNTTYKWSPATGEMFVNGVGQGAPADHKIYMTLWDGGGVDTYDFSNYTTDVTADLRPGEWSSPSFIRNDEFQVTNQVAVLHFDITQFNDNSIYARGSIANAFLFNDDTRSLIENANGGSGNDTLIGNQGNNVLTGNGGDDTFFYTAGSDTFNGGVKGTTGDTADFSLSFVGVVIKPVVSTTITRLPNGQHVLTAIGDTSPLADGSGNAYDVSYFTEIGSIPLANLHGIENITGSSFADTITGNLGDNVINAGDGNDHVFYTGGADTINGGNGLDTIDFSLFGSAVGVTLSSLGFFPEAFTSDTTSIFTGTLRPIAQLANFENAIGSPFADSLIGNSGDNTLDGGAGNDLLLYGGGLDILNGNRGTDTADFSPFASAVLVDLTRTGFEARSNGTENASGGTFFDIADLQSIENLTGTSNNDILRGDDQANVLDGGGGNDTLAGRGGNDALRGGAGNDTYDFRGSGLGIDVFFDDSGTDKILIDNLLNVLGASRVGDNLVVKLTTGSFQVVDHFAGHAIETVQDSFGSVVLATGLIGGDLPGIIAGTDADETLDGRGGDDLLYGGGGRDHLLGGTGNDRLDGGAGKDVLDGGPGDDMLTGGKGHDTFVFAPVEPDGLPGGNDVITDFVQGQDKIDLTAFGTNLNELFGDHYGHANLNELFGDHDGHSNHKGEGGQDAGPITIAAHGNDTVLSFEGGSIDIVGVHHLQANDFIV